MIRRTKRRRTNPIRHVRRRRRNPSTRTNPGGGISGIVMGGAYIGAGMWLGGVIQGFIPNIGSGIIMDLVKGVGSAYIVAMIAGRFTGQAGLMAAGAFAPTAMGLLSSLVGGSGLGSLLGGGSSKQIHSPVTQQIPVAPAPPVSNIAQFPQAG